MKITKKNSNKFFYAVNDFIVNELKAEGGQTNADHNRYEYVVDTIAGRMHINLYDNQIGYSAYAMYCRFEDVSKAKKSFLCNPHSGKYNYHNPVNDVDKAVEWAIMHLDNTQEQVA